MALLDREFAEPVLVVGAGGIGCELIKDLVLSGFTSVDIVDLDTIEVSNLNRQFLFQKRHVGRPKAEVAKESALKLNPAANITHYIDRIQSSQFNKRFFEKYKLILNALDNVAARRHVNRMALAAEVPLIESGSAGYLGQVRVMRKQVTECYDCQPKAPAKTYPGCTIRNTPSEPVHCVVWAKHCFNQLWGEVDIDDDVSPDLEDPELEGRPPDDAPGGAPLPPRVSTRKWAEDHGYDGRMLFNKLFGEDIEYLLRMDNLWKERTPPKPLRFDSHQDATADDPMDGDDTLGRQPYTEQQARDVFVEACAALTARYRALPEGHLLTWDKDDKVGMDFVAACASLRCFNFKIPVLSRFELKSVAGNIIPAIPTTNAVIAGLMVVEAAKVLAHRWDLVTWTDVRQEASGLGRLFANSQPDPPSSTCYVCAPHPSATVRLDTELITVHQLENVVLKGRLGMVAPDAEVLGTGTLVISSDEGEIGDEIQKKTLAELKIVDGSELGCDDFLQTYYIRLNIVHTKDLPDGVLFEVTGEVPAGSQPNGLNGDGPS